MRINTKKLLAIVLVAVMMVSAGCTGWGTDGPADSEPNQSGDSNASDDLEETQNDTNDSEGDSSDGSVTSTSSGGDDTTESDGAPDDSGDSSDDSSSDQSDDDSGTEDSSSSGDSSSEPQSSTGDDSSPDSDDSDGADGSDDSDGSDRSDGTDGDDGGSGDGDEQLTCDAFDTQPEAQMYYDEAPEERGHLDANNDDIPCESLPDGDSSGGDNGDDQDPVGASLTVTVEDQDGNAVEGVEVVGIGPDAEIYSAETNADGQATYDSLPAGDYEYHVTTDGTDHEESTTESISLDDGDDESLTVTVTDADAGVGQSASLTVTVEDQAGNTVEDVEVVGIGPDAEIYSAETNADGQASYDSLPAGDYEYHVTTEGTDYEESSTESITLAGGDDESLTVTVSDTDGGSPAPDEETTITVSVVDDETGESLNDGEVSILFSGWGYEFSAPVEDGTAVFETSDEGIPTVGDEGGDSAEVEFNENVAGYEIDEEATDFTMVVNYGEDNTHTLNLVAEDPKPAPEPPANETPNETAAAV